jgi:hypothetical protein
MELNAYEVSNKEENRLFEFISTGPKGRIIKVVKYSETEMLNLYNLSLSDKDPITGHTDNEIVSNNGDTKKVLATVAATIRTFADKHPGVWIQIFAAEEVRARLYRMTISNNLPAILQHFNVLGVSNNQPFEFEKSGEYEAFLLYPNNVNSFL